MGAERTSGEVLSTLLWRIENISFWDNVLHGNSISSALFKLISVPGNVWHLTLFPKGRYMNNMVKVELNLLLGQDCPGKCRWSLLDENGSSLSSGDSKTITPDIFHPEIKVCLQNFPSYKDIFETMKTSFLPNDSLTLQLLFPKSDGNSPEGKGDSLVTRIEVAEKCFTWRIKQFNNLQLNQEVVTSFCLDFNRVKEMYELKFSLTGDSINDAKFQFEIVAESANKQSLKAIISILHSKQKETVYVTDKHVFESSIHRQTWIPMSNPGMLEGNSDFLHGDQLHLQCKFTAVLNVYHQSICISQKKLENFKIPSNVSNVVTKNEAKKGDMSIPKTIVSVVSKGSIQTSLQYVSQQKSTSMSILGEDLLSMYRDHLLSDFKLSSGDITFPVHKNLLSARSPVFKAMFSSDMKESDCNSLDVPDLDVHTLGRMLTFLYSGTIEDMELESAAKLYYAADKYEVQSLKKECISILQSNITVSCVCDILELADRHQDQELMSTVHDFIGTHFDDVISSDEWDKFSRRSCLAGITMKEVYLKMASLRAN